MYRTEEAERSDISGCAYLNIRGDQICDDEVNTEECQFDLGDCCDVQNDFTLCSDCFCYSAGHLNNSLSKDCPSKSGLELYLEDYIGDGKCQLELNNVEYFFDAGDCCLEYPECTITIQGDSSLWCQLWCVGTFYESHEVVCPEHVCIKSDIYCIPEWHLLKCILLPSHAFSCLLMPPHAFSCLLMHSHAFSGILMHSY